MLFVINEPLLLVTLMHFSCSSINRAKSIFVVRHKALSQFRAKLAKEKSKQKKPNFS